MKGGAARSVLLGSMLFLNFMMLPVWFVPLLPYVKALPGGGSWGLWFGLLMGFGTFTSPLNLTQDNSRLKFYTGKMNNGYLELTQYTQAIPAGTPFMIEYIEGGQVSEGSSFLQVAASAPAFSAPKPARLLD